MFQIKKWTFTLHCSNPNSETASTALGVSLLALSLSLSRRLQSVRPLAFWVTLSNPLSFQNNLFEKEKKVPTKHFHLMDKTEFSKIKVHKKGLRPVWMVFLFPIDQRCLYTCQFPKKRQRILIKTCFKVSICMISAALCFTTMNKHER